ncbi:hypothetical protein LCGC14_2272990, partial [marine sediment metagenome]
MARLLLRVLRLNWEGGAYTQTVLQPKDFEERPRVKRKLSAFPAKALQHLGLLIAFVLIVAAGTFTVERPVLASVLIFAFSLGYLVASVVTRRASFLYGTMLLGAVSYFMACHALGAPGNSFPLLSVPLVAALLAVGHHLRGRLPADLLDYPSTVFRAMDITAGVFALWAVVHVGELADQPGMLRYVAALTFLGYALVYFLHCAAIRKFVYTYVFSVALTLGSVFAVTAVWGVDFAWIPSIASAAVILLAGTQFHPNATHTWARHFYVASVGAIFISLVLALAWWPFVAVALACSSLLLWAAYGWLEKAVPNVLNATMGDRVIAKCFFYGSLGMAMPIAPLIFIVPSSGYVIASALICGLTFSWIVWRRRNNAVAHSNVR